jgi:protein O-mannosyl-transferase
MSRKSKRNQVLSEVDTYHQTNGDVSWCDRFLARARVFHLYFFVSLLGIFVHARSLFFDFTYFDDNVLILDNLPFLQNIRNIITSFSMEVFHVLHGSAAYYRPLLTISFIPDAIIGGSSPFTYHFTNICIHLIASCLLLRLLLALKYSKTFSLFCSLLFVVHPTLTQAVAWIPGRNDSLLAVFVITSFTAFVQYLDRKSVLSLGANGIFFACAIFTKETALLLPGILILFLFIHSKQKRNVLIRFIPIWGGVIALWALLRHHALVNPIPMTNIDMIQSVWNNLPALIQLLGKVFFPFNLSVLPIIQDTTFVWGILATFILISIFVFTLITQSRKSVCMMLFGLMWFVVFLLPSFIRPNPTIVADFIEHRLYLPMIGLFILIAESDLSRHVRGIHRSFLLNVGVGVIIVFSVITFIHERNFSDKITFWTNAAITSPHSPLAQRNLGAMYYLAGDMEMAEMYYKKSLALNVNEQMVNNNLGLIYAARGDNIKAEAAYKRELSINPNYDNAHYNLGLLYYKRGRIEEAKNLWEETLAINPDYTDARNAIEALKASPMR